MHILIQNLERIGLPAIAYIHIQVKELILAFMGLPITKMSVDFFQWVQGKGGILQKWSRWDLEHI